VAFTSTCWKPQNRQQASSSEVGGGVEVVFADGHGVHGTGRAPGKAVREATAATSVARVTSISNLFIDSKQ
jgi:hypothetical protein